MNSSRSHHSEADSSISVSLADKFEKHHGRVLISGVQALVRLMIMQGARDAVAGLKTGGFVSGYRGSPLGTLDTAFATASKQVSAHGIIVQPAVNEELGATAVAGTQQISQTHAARVDGVYALWYGKGPGLDRASDALRHGNYQGSSPLGGVVLAVGDDHVAKSSSIICFSDDVVAGIQVPLFYPADAAEVIAFGLHGFAMSRHTGSYAALKIITEVADSTRAIETGELDVIPVLPEIDIPATGLHNRWPDTPLEQEMRQIEYRLPAVAAYVRANRLDTSRFKGPKSKIGLVAAGKSWLDLREALRLLGLTDTHLEGKGIALYKPALIWPLEPQSLQEFAAGLETIIVIEEKGDFIERQVKAILYGRTPAPAVWGKRGPDGSGLLPATADLTPERIAAAVGLLIADATKSVDLHTQVEQVASRVQLLAKFAVPPVLRKPFFCSGCPHNRSTVVPAGSRALAGIGCHGLAAYNRPFTGSFAQMGGEGMHWVGLAPFTDEKHVFANMGDGTYFHSGVLAIRQAVAANVNMTYKLLYNSAVAMTGGQSVDGALSVEQLIDQIRAEGVATIVLCADDPDRYGTTGTVRSKVDWIAHRDNLEHVQITLRDCPGVSVIIYDQMCATEMRRLRKRGKLPDPPKRVFINEQVCEGCGDCSAKSNCLSVEPLATEFGTKRRINQSSCNKDYSCVTGFCPSFVSVTGASPKRKAAVSATFDDSSLPLPVYAENPHQRIVVGGVGGTGVVTIGALLAVAGHIDGKLVGVLDQVGMAQKGGAVVSHIHVAQDAIAALRIPAQSASLVLVCDEIVGNARDVMAAINREDTHVLVDADVSITGDFTQNRDAIPEASFLTERLRRQVGEGRFAIFPFTQLSNALMGDAIGSNLMMVGYAWQKGWLNVDLVALRAAVELNGTMVPMNLAAFSWGRRLAIESDAVMTAAGLGKPVEVAQGVEQRAAFLTNYQDAAYADAYRTALARVEAAEIAVGGDGRFAEAVARGLFQLMSYKDEYEVGRLYTDGQFAQSLASSFDGDAKLTFHLAPPLIARRDKVTGHLKKRAFGQWIFPVLKLLAKGRRLRGTALDVFGYTAERRMERKLIQDYNALVSQLLAMLTRENHAQAVRIAEMVQAVRGFGHVKEKAVALYQQAVAKALAEMSEANTAREPYVEQERASA